MASTLHTVGRWTTDRALATPLRVAIDDRGVELSYRDLDERAQRLAQKLIDAGCGVGDRIATLTGNSADHVVLFFACAKAGLILVPLSWRLSPREVAEQLAQADPVLFLIDDEFSTLGARAVERLPQEVAIARLGDTGVERLVPALVRSLECEVLRREPVDSDPLLMIFTSGTEAVAKGVVLTHENCFWTNLALSRTAELNSSDVVLAVMPQYHVGGWNIQPLLAWWVGATVILERTFDPGRVLQLIQGRKITTMMGVPANYLFLAEHPLFHRTDLSSLRSAIVGGAPMPEPLLRLWHSRGVSLVQGYGLTEASPNVLCLASDEATERVGMAGKPYPHVQVALADPVTSEHIEGAGQGELLVRGPIVFAQYFRNPQATESVLVDGWLHTGDLAERDADGYYRIVDRIKDIYISGGESVSPAEVESVLMEHPAVQDVAVVGVPSEKWGETGVAFVVLKPAAFATEVELVEWSRDHIARFKAPAAVRFVTALPRSSTHKVLRRELHNQWLTEVSESGSTHGTSVDGFLNRANRHNLSAGMRDSFVSHTPTGSLRAVATSNQELTS